MVRAALEPRTMDETTPGLIAPAAGSAIGETRELQTKAKAGFRLARIARSEQASTPQNRVAYGRLRYARNHKVGANQSLFEA